MFYSVWTFAREKQDFECIGIFTNRGAADTLASEHPFHGRKAAPVLEHATVDGLIDQLLAARLGKMADALRRLEIMVGGPAAAEPSDGVKYLYGESKLPVAAARGDALQA